MIKYQKSKQKGIKRLQKELEEIETKKIVKEKDVTKRGSRRNLVLEKGKRDLRKEASQKIEDLLHFQKKLNKIMNKLKG